MQLRQLIPVAICGTIYLSLIVRKIEANSRSPAIYGDGKVTVNLDDLIIEVTPPRGRDRILNAEPFYERWKYVDDVAYWESIYGSADNIPAFEDLPEIPGESFELKFVEGSENESSNGEDTKTSNFGDSKRIMKKTVSANEAIRSSVKNLSSDRCERINPLYPTNKSLGRQKRETSSVRKEAELNDPKRKARTLSRLRGESVKSRLKSALGSNRRSDYLYNKHGRNNYRFYVPGHGSSSLDDSPEYDDIIDARKPMRFVDSAINQAESVNSKFERDNGGQLVADAMATALGQLAQAKHETIDLDLGGRQAIGFGTLNNAATDCTEEEPNAGETNIDGDLEAVGNYVLDTNSGIINEYTGFEDGIESSSDIETNAAEIDTAVETLANNDVDEVELVGANLKENTNGDAETASDVVTDSKAKFAAGDEGLQEETEAAENAPENFNPTETVVEPRVLYAKDDPKLGTNGVDWADVVGANLEENKDGDTEIASAVGDEAPAVVGDDVTNSGAIEEVANREIEKSGGEETVGSILRIKTDRGFEASLNEGISTDLRTKINVGKSRHRENSQRDYGRDGLSRYRDGSSEEEEPYPREFYPRRYHDGRREFEDGRDGGRRFPQGDRYHEETEEVREYERRFPVGQRHRSNHGYQHGTRVSGIRANSVNTEQRLPVARGGLHANSGIRTSFDDGVDLYSDAPGGHSRTGSGGSLNVGASRSALRDGNYRIQEDERLDGASSEYDEYDEERENGRRLPETSYGDEYHRYRGIKSGIRAKSGIRTSLDRADGINSSGAADGLEGGAESSLDLESHLDIGSTTFGVNGPNPQHLADAINSGVREDGEIHGFHDSRLNVNAGGGGQSRTGFKSSLDPDSHLDTVAETNRPSSVNGRYRVRANVNAPNGKLGEKICESVCRGTSDSGEGTAGPDSRFDDAYDERSEYPGGEGLEVDERGEAARYVCDNCRRRLYGETDDSCPICGRVDDRPLGERRYFSSSGTMYHVDGPRQNRKRAADPGNARGYNRHINLHANCTGEVARRRPDSQGMDYDLRTPRDGNPVPLGIVRTHLSHGHDIALDVHDRARSLVAGGLPPCSHTASMLNFFQSKVPGDFVKLNEESELTLFGTKLLQHKLPVDYNITANTFLEFLNHHGFRVTCDGICRGRRNRCSGYDKFRSLDGSCNNFDNPTWGQSNRAFARILPPRYSDGIYGMPVSVTGAELPNPRKLSVRLYSRRSKRDPELTLAVVQWGQTLAHDLGFQVPDQTTKGGIECCGENGKRELPKSLQHHSCAPICISRRDKFYSSHGQRCMNFVRSMTVAREDCTLGPTDQLNGATSFLDCSPIYGVDKTTSDELREFTGGRMKMEFRSGRWMLPATRNHSSFCDIWTSDDVCYRSGDPRTNQNPQLAILQTLLVREHNRIANGLSALNQAWDDERIFQESRRIVVAEYQHITYNEWLPLLLGERYAKRHGLVRKEPGMSNAYNDRIDPSTIIGFTSGAFRSLHSMIEGNIGLWNVQGDLVKNLRLSDHFFRPRVIEKNNNFEHLLRGLTGQRMQKQNMDFHTEVMEYLFRSRNDYGMDLAAIDIQRGRDHGVPGYNAYRKICRLRPARDFDDLSDEISCENIEKLRRDYAHVDDVDLIVGVTMENRVPGSHFGPTNRCLIGEQFYRSRVGDSYFYDNENFRHSFTPEQLDEITKVTLSRLMCDMGGAVAVVQRDAFRATSSKNPLVPCEDLPKLDLTFWIE